jgi:hypothetical protein
MIRIVFYRDGDDDSIWIAHCLEFDLMGHGSTQSQALNDLSIAISIQIDCSLESENMANLFCQAPPEFQLMYARGDEIARGHVTSKVFDDDSD